MCTFKSGSLPNMWQNLAEFRSVTPTRRHVVGQEVVSDISVVRSFWSIGNLCSEYNSTNLLLRLFDVVLGASTLLYIPNIDYPTRWRRLLGDFTFTYLRCG